MAGGIPGPYEGLGQAAGVLMGLVGKMVPDDAVLQGRVLGCLGDVGVGVAGPKPCRQSAQLTPHGFLALDLEQEAAMVGLIETSTGVVELVSPICSQEAFLVFGPKNGQTAQVPCPLDKAETPQLSASVEVDNVQVVSAELPGLLRVGHQDVADGEVAVEETRVVHAAQHRP